MAPNRKRASLFQASSQAPIPRGARREQTAGASSPHTSQPVLRLLQVEFLAHAFPMPHPCLYCSGQRAEHRSFPSLCLPSQGQFQPCGFPGVFLGSPRGGVLTIKTLDPSLLTWGGLCFLKVVSSPLKPLKQLVCCPVLFFPCSSYQKHGLGSLILTHGLLALPVWPRELW